MLSCDQEINRGPTEVKIQECFLLFYVECLMVMLN